MIVSASVSEDLFIIIHRLSKRINYESSDDFIFVTFLLGRKGRSTSAK